MPILSSSSHKIKEKRLKHLNSVSRNLKNDSRKSMSTLGLPPSDSSRNNEAVGSKTLYKSCFRSAQKFNFAAVPQIGIRAL